MFDFGIGYTEIMVVAMVALIVIGPKDLPKVLRHIGQMTAAMRRMAGEFQRHLDDAMKETGMDDVRREVNAMKSGVTSALTGGGLDETVRKTENDIRNAMTSTPAAPTPPAAPAASVPEASGPAAALPPATATPAATPPASPAPEAAPAQPAAPATQAAAAPSTAANGRDHA